MTVANAVGRSANILILLAVVALFGATPYTDRFFFFIALAYYFYGTLSYAATESSIPIILYTRSALSLKGIAGLGLISGSAVLTVACLWNVIFPVESAAGYVLGLSLMAGAGIANGFVTGILYANERYIMPGLSWALRFIPLLLFVSLRQPPENLYMLAIGIGAVDWLRFAVLALFNSKGVSAHQPSRTLVFLKNHLPQFLPLVLAMLIMGLNPIVDRLIAGIGGPGCLSVLDAADRFFGILVTLCTLGLMTVLMTRLSKSVLNGSLTSDWHKVILMVGAWSGFWLAVGIAAGHWVLGDWLSRATALSTVQSQTVQRAYWYYLIGLFPFALCVVYIKRLQAVRRPWTLSFTSAFTVALNIPASLLLLRLMDIPGIALATSLVNITNCLILSAIVHRRNHRG